MSEAANSRLVAETVIDQLNLQMTAEEFLEDHLSVEQVPETQFIQINYEDSSPESARYVPIPSGRHSPSTSLR
jgi:capsular polysaccharide biosynthesis protein